MENTHLNCNTMSTITVFIVFLHKIYSLKIAGLF